MTAIVESRCQQGIVTRYSFPVTKDKSKGYDIHMPLQTIDIYEKYGWDLDIEGIRLFEDYNLTKLKNKYAHEKSKKRKADK